MSETLKWSGVCVHCRAPISGQVQGLVKFPKSFRQFCPSCGEQVLVTLLKEGAMIASWRRYLKEERKKP